RVAGVDVEPDDLALALVRLLHRRVEHLDRAGADSRRAADVGPDAVATQQTDDGVVGEVPLPVAVNGDAGAGRRGGPLLVAGCSAHGAVRVRERGAAAIRPDLPVVCAAAADNNGAAAPARRYRIFVVLTPLSSIHRSNLASTASSTWALGGSKATRGARACMP